MQWVPQIRPGALFIVLLKGKLVNNFQWKANKYFTIYLLFAVMFGMIAGLNLNLGNMKAGGIFTAITILLGIFSATWGFYPEALMVRRRNLWRVALFLISHVFVYFFVEGGKSIDALCKINHPAEIAGVISKTSLSLIGTAEAGMNMLAFKPVSFENILWVYLILFTGFCISCYKVLGSWGWPCIITFGLALGTMTYTLRCWMSMAEHWRIVFVLSIVCLCFLSACFGKKHWSSPAMS